MRRRAGASAFLQCSNSEKYVTGAISWQGFFVHKIAMRWIALALLLLAVPAARAAVPTSIPGPSALCRSAILMAERTTRIPDRLLDAIAVVESGRRDPVTGAVFPWPWTINAEGVGHFYESKAEAIAAAQGFLVSGIRSIDVGCMQVNLAQHPNAFATLDQAFDPMANAAYAARFLTQLFNQTNAWPLAAAAYHSMTPDLGAEYARKVLAAWGVPQLPLTAMAVQPQAVMGATPIAPFGPPASLQAPPGGRVAVMLPPSGAAPIRAMTLPGSAPTAMAGRGLDQYRAIPIRLAQRAPRAG